MIDAHHHLWSYNERDYAWMNDKMGALRRDYLIPELQAVTHAGGVDATIVVQARQMLEETQWLLEIAQNHPQILGVVGWVPLTAASARDQLSRFAGDARLRAVRHVLHDEPDDFYMLREDFNRGIDLLPDFNLVYDILIFERHLPQTLVFVDRHPNQLFVVDHIAKPRIRENVMSPWKEQIRELARRENVYCKVSGMATEADWDKWTSDQLRPYFDVVLSAFGANRLMFGSDWPVVELASSYQSWAATFRSFIHDLSIDEQTKICSGTAIAAYGIAPNPGHL